jgi:hypothetical protein
MAATLFRELTRSDGDSFEGWLGLAECELRRPYGEDAFRGLGMTEFLDRDMGPRDFERLRRGGALARRLRWIHLSRGAPVTWLLGYPPIPWLPSIADGRVAGVALGTWVWVNGQGVRRRHLESFRGPRSRDAWETVAEAAAEELAPLRGMLERALALAAGEEEAGQVKRYIERFVLLPRTRARECLKAVKTA